MIAVAAVVALLLAGMVGWLMGVRSGEAARPGDAAGAGDVARATTPADPDLGPAPSYDGLTNQLGQRVSSSAFAGKVQVVTFLFPYCTTYCPLVAAHLAGLEHTLERAGMQDRVSIVAFDVDPAGTGPAQMRAFLKEYGWDPSDTHWQYLTGDPKVIRHVVTDGYHVDYRKVSAAGESQGNAAAGGPAGAADAGAAGAGAAGGAASQAPPLAPQPQVVNELARRAHIDYDIVHNDALVLVGPKGRLRKFYTDADVVSTADLLNQIDALLSSGKRP